MQSATVQPSRITLSICIGTFNRAGFIGETIESIIAQAPSDCEIVVSDNASTDGTEELVLKYARSCDRLRYVKQETNVGLDRNFDRAVELARGEYCWLLSDDDLLKPGAIAAVLEVLRQDYVLVLINGDHWDLGLSKVLAPNFFGIDSDRVYGAGELDRLFEDIGKCSICISCYVIKRAVWIAREKKKYYGSMFIHVAVAFQERLPGRALTMAHPMIKFRWGNENEWGDSRAAEIFYFMWPTLVWSLALSDSTKRRHCSKEPWRRLKYLLPSRALGWYTLDTYRSTFRPYLCSLREKAIPIVILLVPCWLARGFYIIVTLVTGTLNSSEEALRRTSMLPESLDSLIWPNLPKRLR